MHNGVRRRRRTWISSLLVIAFLAGIAKADDAPRFVLHTSAEKDHAGELKQIGAGWKVLLLENDEFARGNAEDLISLRREKAVLPAPPNGEHLILANGDALPGELVELVGESLSFKAKTGVASEIKVPLSALSVLWLAAPEGTEHPEQFRREIALAKRARDTVYLRNGDIVEGVISSLDRKRVQVDVNEKDVTIELGKVAAVALNSDLAKLAAPKEPHARVVLANGGRVTLVSARCDGKLLLGKPVFGGEIKVPVAELVSLDMLGGAAAYLSDLKPAKYEAKSFLGGTPWAYVADASAAKGLLRIAGSTYDKGLGMHAEARLTYALGSKYRRFETRVGLDDRAAPAAAARVSVLVDGKAQDLGTVGELTRRGVVRTIRVDVTGAKELTLVVEFSPRLGAVPGDVDWVEARLVK